MAKNNDDPLGVKRRYERDFGEGSWEKLEAGVRARHPQFFAMMDRIYVQEHETKWWQVWKWL